MFWAAQGVMSFAQKHFLYVPDDLNYRAWEHWASYEELKRQLLEGDGIVRDDCDGFARLCQMQFAEMGIDAAVLVCITETGDGHLVCEVGGSPTQSGWVLDNRRIGVTSRARLAEEGYRFLAYAKDGKWIELQQEAA